MRKQPRRPAARTARLSLEQLEGREVPSAVPYLTPTAKAVEFTPVLTTGDSVGGYRMAGIPDGLGAFDNGDGTFTVLMNHEHNNTEGVAHTHNASLGAAGKGAFVSKWVIDKSTLQVLSGGDLIQTLALDGSTSLNLSRLCSADLPAVSAYFDPASGLGTTERIFMDGEEVTGGRAFGHVVTGPLAGTSYELPLLGRFAHENVLANPFAQVQTVVAGLDDTTPSPTNGGGRVYIYIGTKTAAGTPVDQAGPTNGTNVAIQVHSPGFESPDLGLRR